MATPRETFVSGPPEAALPETSAASAKPAAERAFDAVISVAGISTLLGDPGATPHAYLLTSLPPVVPATPAWGAAIGALMLLGLGAVAIARRG